MNIFDIEDWDGGQSYVKNSIVAWPAGIYWYAINPNTNSQPSISNPDWGGRVIVDNGEYPKFIWTPSYNITKKIDAKIKQIQFGDGYKQVVADGINNTLLVLDLNFDGIDVYEASAILHFFLARAGSETFIYVPPSPYSTIKKWKVLSWSDAQPFYNNYNIRTTFEEVLI